MPLKDYFNPELKKIKIDFSAKCNSNCIGCFTHASEHNPNERLNLETIYKILDFAGKENFSHLVIAAIGEPLIDKDYFYRVIEYANKKGLEAIVYCNGTLITKEDAKKLYSLNISLLIKRNSMSHQKQNQLMNSNNPNLSQMNLTGIKNLINAGFNGKRLALESYISKENYQDLEDVLRFCRKNNLTPYFEEFISVNQKPEILKKMALTPEKLQEIFKDYQKIDQQEFGINIELYQNSRRYGMPACFVRKMMSVDVKGNIKRCILYKIYGNIYQDNLNQIFLTIPKTCTGCSMTVLV